MKVRAAPHAALALNKNLNEKAREHKRQKHLQEHNETPTEAWHALLGQQGDSMQNLLHDTAPVADDAKPSDWELQNQRQAIRNLLLQPFFVDIGPSWPVFPEALTEAAGRSGRQ